MSDKELLQMAAKAAGYHYKPKNACIVVDGIPGVWNPLTDDGDALRLAVKLNLHVCRYETMTTARPLFGSFGCDERDDGDPYAATRRAIVCAAAEIGRQMNE